VKSCDQSSRNQKKSRLSKPTRDQLSCGITSLDNEVHIAEVRFFIQINIEGVDMALALVSLFSKPDESLLSISMNTLWSCEYQGNDALQFIDVKTIQAVVAMIPHRVEILGFPHLNASSWWRNWDLMSQ